MTNSTNRDWLTEGAEAAVTTGGPYGHTEFARVGRVTATVVVLADGRRYSRRDLSERENRGRPDTRLADPKNPGVMAAFAREQLLDFARVADRLVSGSGATVFKMTPSDVRDALDDLADKLNAARKEVDRRAGL